MLADEQTITWDIEPVGDRYDVIKGDLDSTAIDLFVNSSTRRRLEVNKTLIVVLVRDSGDQSWRSVGIADGVYQQVVRRILAVAQDWSGPADGEQPAAYIVILGDSEIRREFGVDHGIAAQSIMLGATEKGLGGCIIASIDRLPLREALSIADKYQILLVLALGKPREKVVVEDLGSDRDIKILPGRRWRASRPQTLNR